MLYSGKIKIRFYGSPLKEDVLRAIEDFDPALDWHPAGLPVESAQRRLHANLVLTL